MQASAERMLPSNPTVSLLDGEHCDCWNRPTALVCSWLQPAAGSQWLDAACWLAAAHRLAEAQTWGWAMPAVRLA